MLRLDSSPLQFLNGPKTSVWLGLRNFYSSARPSVCSFTSYLFAVWFHSKYLNTVGMAAERVHLHLLISGNGCIETVLMKNHLMTQGRIVKLLQLFLRQNVWKSENSLFRILPLKYLEQNICVKNEHEESKKVLENCLYFWSSLI